MYHLAPKWKWPICGVEKTYQLVPKRDPTNSEVVETYQLAPKWDWLIWHVKRTCQVMPKKDGPIWGVTKTYHRDLGFMKVKSLLAWTISGFSSQILTIHRTSGEGRRSFIPLYHFHLLTNIDTFICNFAYEMNITYF